MRWAVRCDQLATRRSTSNGERRSRHIPQPLFFISYSRPRESNRKPIDKAVDKLRSRVAELLGHNRANIDEIGFFDVDNIQNGAD